MRDLMDSDSGGVDDLNHIRTPSPLMLSVLGQRIGTSAEGRRTTTH